MLAQRRVGSRRGLDNMYNEEDHAAEAEARTQQGHDRPSQGSGFNNI